MENNRIDLKDYIPCQDCGDEFRANSMNWELDYPICYECHDKLVEATEGGTE